MYVAVWSVLLVLLAQVLAIPRELFYSYGPGLDQVLPRDQDEVSSPEIELKVPIIFYGEIYGTIYVNANGLLSFLTEIPSFFNIQFPLDYPVIAPLYTNVDTRGSGSVYYRETQDPQTLEKVSEKIRDAFSFAEEFTAKSAFIATWENVGYFNRGADKVNTFQVVISSDGTDSYVEMLYADNGIQWIQGQGQASGLPDARAQAGLVSGDGRLFTLRGSGTDQIQNLDKWSNVGVDGVWLFHVGQTGSTGNVMPPNVEVGSDIPLINTCATGATTCHSKANCIDYPNEGFCCACQHGYYGNGLNCLKDGIPVRVNGKITGILNGENLTQMDLQSYVVTSDGRTYTALSNVNVETGYNMQVLNILGGVIGWQFSRSVNKALNGYQLTGGIFNHTADITFPQTGDKVTLRQRYHGLDVFDQLKMEAEVRGTLPIIPIGKKIHISDYEEQYTRTAPGVLLSQSSQAFQLDGQPVDVPFTITQTFLFEECPYATTNVSTFRLKVARNFISYEAREKILRYGMTNKISPLGEEDPCQSGKSKCGQHSSCIVDGDTFKCVCNPGFQFLYEETEGIESAVCVDINECTTGIHDCDINAICVNEPGSFACQCKAGYSGDGRRCKKLPTCEDLNCHPNAECIRRSAEVLQCQCSAGYIGDGVDCAPFSPHETCDIANDCSQYATCNYDEQVGHYVCMCLHGYVGNGYICTEASYNASSEDSPAPQCVLGICFCPSGYELIDGICIRSDSPYEEDGNSQLEARPLPACFTPSTCVCPRGYVYQQDKDSCNPVPGHPVHSQGTKGPSGTKLSCNIVNTCHPHAQCVFTSSLGRYQCHCNAGYEGDGYECTEIDVSCLQVDICDIHASCTFDESRSRAICVCNPGYQGDGTLCTPLHECSSPEDCGSNARCMWSSAHEHYECVCNPGFVKEGPVCITVQDSGCNIINDCDSNAQCVYDPNSEQHHCRCSAGFSGDGKTCTADPIGCNILNNCDLAADCVYDQGAAGYRCRCRAGFRGNGLQCTPELSCQQDSRICSSDASCVLSSVGQYECQCNDGYTGNGIICRATSKHDSNFLLLNQGMATLRIPYNPTSNNPGKPIAIQYYQMAIGIDIDCIEGRVYWSDITGKTIKSSKYDGTDVQNFLTSDIGSPEGISIDWVSRNVYWTDSSKDTIEVASLDTKLRKVIVSKDLVNPRGIAVHPARGKLFWADWDRAAPKLEWANLDGTSRSIFLQGPAVKLPNSLSIDFERDEVCWADAGSKAIECVGISTNLRRTVVTNCSYPFGLTISPENYYWTDWNTQKIESAQRPSGKMNKPIHVPLGGSGKLYGIVSVPEHCPRLTNACQFDSGSCGEGRLCLPNGHGGRSCVCADSDGEGSGEAAVCNDVI